MNKPAVAILRKDLRATRLFWAPMAFSYFAFLLMFMQNIWVYLATGACLAFVAAVTVLILDDHYRTDPLYAALPGTRRSLVAGRYLSWGTFTVASLACFLAFTAAIHGRFNESAPRLASLLSLKGVMAFLAGTVLTAAFFLPLHFRLGFWRAIWTFTVAGLVLVTAGLNLLAGLLPTGVDAAPQSVALPGAFASTARGLRVLALLIDQYLGRPDVAAGAVVLLVVIGYLSFRLSVRFYERRDL